MKNRAGGKKVEVYQSVSKKLNMINGVKRRNLCFMKSTLLACISGKINCNFISVPQCFDNFLICFSFFSRLWWFSLCNYMANTARGNPLFPILLLPLLSHTSERFVISFVYENNYCYLVYLNITFSSNLYYFWFGITFCQLGFSRRECFSVLFYAFQKQSVVYQTKIRSRKFLAQEYWNYFPAWILVRSRTLLLKSSEKHTHHENPYSIMYRHDIIAKVSTSSHFVYDCIGFINTKLYAYVCTSITIIHTKGESLCGVSYASFFVTLGTFSPLSGPSFCTRVEK